MLDRLLVRQVRRRLEASGLPLMLAIDAIDEDGPVRTMKVLTTRTPPRL